jgi:hypothetical protein
LSVGSTAGNRHDTLVTVCNALATCKDDAGTAELAGLCQFGGNISGVTNCRALAGFLEADQVGKKPIPVNDMKKVSHTPY